MEAEYARLITQGHEEPGLDYKGPMAWDESDRKACCEFVKDIMALANYGGGWIVVGVAEPTPGQFVPQGLSAEQAASYEPTRIGRTLRKYCEPPVAVTVHKVPHDGRDFVLIGVPGFDGLPHMCIREFPGVLRKPWVYVRNQACESVPLSTQAELSSLVERAIRNRRDEMLRAVSAVLRGARPLTEQGDQQHWAEQIGEAEAAFRELAARGEPQGSHFIVVSHPETFQADRIPLETLERSLERASESLTGWPFFYLHNRGEDYWAINDGFESDVRGTFPAPHHDFYQVRSSGLVYHAELLCEDWLPAFQGKRVIDYALVVIRIALAVRAVTRLYEGSVDPEESVWFTFQIDDAEGREVGTSEVRRLIRPGYACRVSTVRTTATRTLADWTGAMVEQVVELSRDVFRRFNFPDSNPDAIRDIAERTYSRRL